MRSWLARESFLTRRPKSRIGAITSGTPSTTSAVSLGLVMISMTRAPAMIRVFLNANEAEEPITTSSSAVSLVRREIASPVRMVSKNPGDCSSRCPNTARRMSAETRSPIHDTE